MSIIVYTKTGCPWCKGALDYMNENHIEYEEREVLRNPKFFEELVSKSGQNKTPTFDIDGHILADSDKDQLATYLAEKITQ